MPRRNSGPDNSGAPHNRLKCADSKESLDEVLGLTKPSVEAESADRAGSDPRAAKPVNYAELDSVVRRLLGVIGSYLITGAQTGLRMKRRDVLQVIDEVIKEAGGDGSYTPRFEPSVEGVFMLGLYEELVQEPSNICEKVTWPDGSTAWMGLTPDCWRHALEMLRETTSKRLPTANRNISAEMARERLVEAKTLRKK